LNEATSTDSTLGVVLAIIGLLAGSMLCWRRYLPWQNIFAAGAIALGAGALAQWFQNAVLRPGEEPSALLGLGRITLWPALALASRLAARNACYRWKDAPRFGFYVIGSAAVIEAWVHLVDPFPRLGHSSKAWLLLILALPLLPQIVSTPWLVDKRLKEAKRDPFIGFLLAGFFGALAMATMVAGQRSMASVWIRVAMGMMALATGWAGSKRRLEIHPSKTVR
jgi:hypothetical protein